MFTQLEPKIQMIKYTAAHHVSFEIHKKITDSILIHKAVLSIIFFHLTFANASVQVPIFAFKQNTHYRSH